MKCHGIGLFREEATDERKTFPLFASKGGRIFPECAAGNKICTPPESAPCGSDALIREIPFGRKAPSAQRKKLKEFAFSPPFMTEARCIDYACGGEHARRKLLKYALGTARPAILRGPIS